MSEQKQHEPTPWEIRPIELYECGIGFEIVGANEKVVHDTQTYYPMAITRENAEFITTAVNAYHRHSVALAKILALCKQASKGDPMAEVYDIVAKTMDSYDVQEALADEVKP